MVKTFSEFQLISENDDNICKCSVCTLGEDYILNNRMKEDSWKEEFEILSIRINYSDTEFSIAEKGTGKFDDLLDELDFEKVAYNQKNMVEINSVKRLVDDSIFTLGSYVYMNGRSYMNIPISKIWPSLYQMRIDFGKGGGVVLNHTFIKNSK